MDQAEMNDEMVMVTKDGRITRLSEKPGVRGGLALMVVGIPCALAWSTLAYWLWPTVGPWILTWMR